MNSAFRDRVLDGKVAFISGGTSGINLGIAERFAQLGAKLCVLGRNQEKLDAAVAQLKGHGGEVLGVSADVRDAAAVTQAVSQAAEKLGALDILICGAAGNFPAPAIGMSSNGFKAVVDIDLLGTFNVCRAAFEHLRQPGASVIAISAPQAFQPTAFQAHVCAAKAGVDMLVKTLAIEWGPAGIRVNALTPGPVENTEGMRRLAPTPEATQKVAEALPLKRLGTTGDLADAALFLATDASRYVTGIVLPCDGGQSLIGSGALASAIGFG
jgi:NAD(P)-dependent dehydrogenase (short-subunit alcohol dehydrogenase family)